MQRTRRVVASLGIVAVALLGAACVPIPHGAPEANPQGTCYGASWEATARKELAHTGLFDRFMTDIMPDESGCDPCAYYPSKHNCDAEWPSTAKGLTGLTSGKDRALKDACPFAWLEAWHMASCQLRVTRWIVEAEQAAGRSGLGPWQR